MPRFNVTSSYSILFDAATPEEAAEQMDKILQGPMGKIYEKTQKVRRVRMLAEMFDFSEALKLLKQKYAIRRAIWPKSSRLFLFENAGMSRMEIFGSERGDSDSSHDWTPDADDLVADDWELYEV